MWTVMFAFRLLSAVIHTFLLFNFVVGVILFFFHSMFA